MPKYPKYYQVTNTSTITWSTPYQNNPPKPKTFQSVKSLPHVTEITTSNHTVESLISSTSSSFNNNLVSPCILLFGQQYTDGIEKVWRKELINLMSRHVEYTTESLSEDNNINNLWRNLYRANIDIVATEYCLDGHAHELTVALQQLPHHQRVVLHSQ